MPYCRAISLLLLQQGVSAFQAAPNFGRSASSLSSLKQQFTSLRTAALEAIPPLESILDDGHGHINSNLAQAIYEWEVAHNDNNQKLDNSNKQFSTRDGLRLVDELAREILSSLSDDDDNGTGSDNDNDGSSSRRKSGISYSDLVQEGMIALLRAMSTYDNYRVHTRASNIASFEEYANQSIQTSLLHFLAASSRPIRLPLSLQTTLRTANVAAEKLRQSMGKEPSLVQVANEAGIAPEQLALYRKLHRSMVSRVGTFVSVEDGMEVYDPTLAGVGIGTGLRSRRDMESLGVEAEGNHDLASPDDMAASPSDTSTATNEQDLTHLNSQEDDWTREPPERVVTPLRDVLTDTEEINNPLSYTLHYLLNEELNEFIDETLTEDELAVIQLRFGLVDSKHGGKGWTASEIGERMGLDRQEVVRVASGALEKLRRAASTNWEEEAEMVEVSL